MVMRVIKNQQPANPAQAQKSTLHSTRPKPQAQVTGGPVQTEEQKVINQATGVPVTDNKPGKSTLISLPESNAPTNPRDTARYEKYRQGKYAPADTNLLSEEAAPAVEARKKKPPYRKARNPIRRQNGGRVASVLGSQDTLG